MKILVLNGPNLNLLGIREPEQYGNSTYKDLEKQIKTHCKTKKVQVAIKQTNYEGKLVDFIQKAKGKYGRVADAVKIIDPRQE